MKIGDDDSGWEEWQFDDEEGTVGRFQTDCECYTRDFEVCVECGHSSFCRGGDCSHDGDIEVMRGDENREDIEELESVEEIIDGAWLD